MKQILDYSIPTDWNEITIKQQLEVERLVKEYPDFKSLAILSGYSNIPMDTLKRMPINQVKILLEQLKFISSPLPQDQINEFEYKGETYSVIPTLLKSETQDFLTLTSVDSRPDSLLYVVAILAKKKVNGKFESLSDFDLNERAIYFQDLPITIANRIHVFFCLISTLSQIDSKQILNQFDQSLKESINSILITGNKRVGGGLFIRFVRMTLLSYLKYLKLNWNKFYSGYNLDQQRVTLNQKLKRLLRKRLKRK